MFAQAQRSVGIVQRKLILLTATLLCSLLLSPLALAMLYCPKCKEIKDVDVKAECPDCGYQAVSASDTDGPDVPDAGNHAHSNQMAVELFLQAAQMQPNASFVISPHSLFQALTFLLWGADGQTLELLQNYLGQISHYQEGMAVNAEVTPDDVLTQGAAMVLADGLDIQSSYQQILNELNVKMHTGVNFSDPPSLQELAKSLNQAISESTHGMIKDFCDPNGWSEQTLFIILTSIYFHGTWETPLECFENCGTFTAPGQQQKILKKVLKQNLTNTQYAELNGWKAVAVPYNEGYEMVLILPPHGVFPHQADQDELNKLLKMLSHSIVELEVPPFKTNSYHNLEPLMKAVGLGGIFQSGGLSMGNMLVRSRSDLCLGLASQQCGIMMDEHGTVGAAATQLCSLESYVPPPTPDHNVIFDHPFMYVVREKGGRRSIMFTGQVMNPEVL